MFYVGDFPAKTSQQQGKELGLQESVRAFGSNLKESLKRCGLSLSSSKTPRCLELEGLSSSSKDLPAWGMMQNGVSWELGTSARLIKETECGSKPWPTPATRDYKGGHSPNALTRKDGKSRMDVLPNVAAYRGLTTQQMSELKQDSSERAQNLNPNWTEWLMGWPIGWTDLKPLEMDRCPNARL